MKFLFTLYFISTLVAADNNLYKYNNPLNQSLGRDNDPKLTEDLSNFKLWIRKATWSTLSMPGMRFMANLIFPKSTVVYFDTDEKIVAFTIDDGFCGKDNPDGDMTEEVRKLFKKYDAKATFFTTGSHCMHTDKEKIQRLLSDGHEIANHGMYDWPYNNYSEEQFEQDFMQTDQILRQYTDNIPKYYRAPHAKFSKTMQNVLDEKGYTHIICDGFANDTSIPDAKWISKFILKKTKPGSILLIHMPEKGIREWNYEAIELTLKGLKEKGYRVTTISELEKLSQSKL